jgi:hypothetical protein
MDTAQVHTLVVKFAHHRLGNWCLRLILFAIFLLFHRYRSGVERSFTGEALLKLVHMHVLKVVIRHEALNPLEGVNFLTGTGQVGRLRQQCLADQCLFVREYVGSNSSLLIIARLVLVEELHQHRLADVRQAPRRLTLLEDNLD